MIQLTTEIKDNVYGTDGAMEPLAREGYLRLYTIGGTFNKVIFGYNANYGQVYSAVLYAAGASGGVAQYSDYAIAGFPSIDDHDSGHLDFSRRITDNDMLTATNGGNLLILANKYKDYFFEGVDQTAATLFEYMQRMYGQDYTGFYSNSGGYELGTQLYKDPWSRIVDLTSLEIAFDKAEGSGINQIYPSAYSFTGADYGAVSVPAEIPSGDNPEYIAAYLIFSGITPDPQANLHFDVYVNGTSGPNVSIRWKATTDSTGFPLNTIQPQVFNGFPMITDQQQVWYMPDYEVGCDVPFEHANKFQRKSYEWSGSSNIVMDGLFDERYGSLSEVAKLAFSPLGHPMSMKLALRFDQPEASGRQWGDVWEVNIPYKLNSVADIGCSMKSGTRNNPDFTTTCAVHMGLPPDQAPDDTPPGGGTPPGYTPGGEGDFDPDEPTGFSGKSVLTKTYSMIGGTLANVGSKLWSQSYYDVLKVQNNPIENIISVKWFPFDIQGTVENIKVGNVDFGIGADVINNLYIIDFGSKTYTGWNKLPGFMNCSPYTTCKLHLPYAGTVQLDASDIINKPLYIKLVIDLVTGDVLYLLRIGSGKAPYMNVSGKMGVDIPLTASNRAQTELASASKQLSAVIGGVGSIISGNAAGAVASASGIVSAAGMDFTCQRTATHSPACSTYENRAVYMEVSYPDFEQSTGFEQDHGYPTYKYYQLSTLTGFVKVDTRTKINLAMTQRENEMLEQLLTEGIYI